MDITLIQIVIYKVTPLRIKYTLQYRTAIGDHTKLHEELYPWIEGLKDKGYTIKFNDA